MKWLDSAEETDERIISLNETVSYYRKVGMQGVSLAFTLSFLLIMLTWIIRFTWHAIAVIWSSAFV